MSIDRLSCVCWMMVLLAGCRGEKTIYVSTFNRQAFWEASINMDISAALEAVGLPMQAWLYYTGSDPDGRSREIRPLTEQAILQAANYPSSYIVCYYSIQADARRDYVRCELYFVGGRLEKKLEALVA